MKRALGVVFVVVCAVMIVLPTRVNSAMLPANIASVQPEAPAYAGERCQVILAKAMETLQSTCQKVGRNKACYGNNLVQAEPMPSANLNFSVAGDIANISQIRSITTAPLDEEKGTWGLSLLKLQASLPDSLPGQNVTFLVFGNTHVDNTSGDMRSFYFTSGLGAPTCKEAPKDSIVVKSPNHMQVTFNANGTQITIASTIVLRAEKSNKMTVALVEGLATVTTPQGSQDLKPGQQVDVPLGGETGLAPVAAPSQPVDFMPDMTDPATTKMIETAQDLGRDPVNVNTISTQGNQNTANPNTVPQGNPKPAKEEPQNVNSGSSPATGNGNGKSNGYPNGSSNGPSNGGKGGKGSSNGNGNGNHGGVGNGNSHHHNDRHDGHGSDGHGGKGNGR